jgi:hypothetical protein
MIIVIVKNDPKLKNVAMLFPNNGLRIALKIRVSIS